MKKFKKVIALLCAAAMLTGALSGCGKKDPAEDKTPDKPTTAPTAAAGDNDSEDTGDDTPAAVPGVEGYVPFAEKVSLRIPIYDRGVEGVPTVNDNYWTKWVQENFGDKYNITVEYVPITRTDVMTDYALLASAGKLPTLLMEYDYPKVSQWASEGYLRTFNMDDFAAVAPDYYNRMVEENQLLYSTMNGETYFALAQRPYYNTNYTYQTFVRMDWLKKVGYDHVPLTRAELVDAMTKIQQAGLAKHPLGKALITGVGSDQNYGYRTFPMDEAWWASMGDVNIPMLGQEANKKLLKVENEDYNLGFTNPEYYITDAETEKANFVNGTAYRYGGYISANMDWLNSFYANNPDAELAIQPMGVVDEEAGTVPAYRTNNPFGMIVGFSSKATEDEIKAAWMYMEWMTQEENLFVMQWGLEGEHYNVDAASGLPVSVGEYTGDKKQGFNNNKDYWCVTIEARNAGTIEDIIAAASPKGLPQDFTQDIIDVYYAQKELFEQGYGCLDVIFGVPIAAEVEYAGTLQERYKEYRDKLTMCKPEEFDALYEQYAKEYEDAGYKEVMEERLAAYQAGNSTKLPDYQKK
ncbi:putative aldouronate transport system substrate-binding protein [Anaerotaenia torta]|uniref:extracellular solute-binding protein n=1 Tax=Anaerotaenia torta TaxID=433293 RepID=UPI003D21CBED